jgi:hypothetical protein
MFEPSRSDLRLLRRALSQGWDVPAEMREKIIEVLGAIVSDEKSTRRERTSAARAVVQASRVELDAIRVAQGALFENLFQRMEALEGGGDAKLANAGGEDGSAGAAPAGSAG